MTFFLGRFVSRTQDDKALSVAIERAKEPGAP
jgi:hypothetical protein